MDSKILKYLKEYSIITLGCFFYAISINYFFISNHLAEGGVAGICLILYYLFKLPVGVMYFVINIPLLIIGWRLVGRDFLFKTLYGTSCLSFLITLTQNWKGPSSDIMLGSIYGGVLIGIGLGLIFMVNGSTGGTDIIARILNRYFDIPMGRTMLFLDIVILGVATIFFGKEIVMYTLISMAIVSKAIDYFQDGYTKSKGITIISTKSEEIKSKIMDKIGRGTTIIKGKGGYTGKEIDLLFCVVSKFEVTKVKNIVKEIDAFAFLTISDVSEVLGEGFKSLHNKKQ
ncbi:YitT family protein [Fusobacterium mortiferum]|uniref:YitT family protein n=2 Tax=Fusobacterium TaxID=848 RepID=A0ABS2G1A0_FUSMR|nr:YitT family protein [uncultured Fusobacterium sp.]MBM6874785.1 YitT family protein [Fusobacterium mortiferum]MBU3841970.1 YitT family protein [Candidatus Fusobacterium pullicola]